MSRKNQLIALIAQKMGRAYVLGNVTPGVFGTWRGAGHATSCYLDDCMKIHERMKRGIRESFRIYELEIRLESLEFYIVYMEKEAAHEEALRMHEALTTIETMEIRATPAERTELEEDLEAMEEMTAGSEDEQDGLPENWLDMAKEPLRVSIQRMYAQVQQKIRELEAVHYDYVQRLWATHSTDLNLVMEYGRKCRQAKWTHKDLMAMGGAADKARCRILARATEILDDPAPRPENQTGSPLRPMPRTSRTFDPAAPAPEVPTGHESPRGRIMQRGDLILDRSGIVWKVVEQEGSRSTVLSQDPEGSMGAANYAFTAKRMGGPVQHTKRMQLHSFLSWSHTDGQAIAERPPWQEWIRTLDKKDLRAEAAAFMETIRTYHRCLAGIMPESWEESKDAPDMWEIYLECLQINKAIHRVRVTNEELLQYCINGQWMAECYLRRICELTEAEDGEDLIPFDWAASPERAVRMYNQVVQKVLQELEEREEYKRQEERNLLHVEELRTFLLLAKNNGYRVSIRESLGWGRISGGTVDHTCVEIHRVEGVLAELGHGSGIVIPVNLARVTDWTLAEEGAVPMPSITDPDLLVRHDPIVFEQMKRVAETLHPIWIRETLTANAWDRGEAEGRLYHCVTVTEADGRNVWICENVGDGVETALRWGQIESWGLSFYDGDDGIVCKGCGCYVWKDPHVHICNHALQDEELELEALEEQQEDLRNGELECLCDMPSGFRFERVEPEQGRQVWTHLACGGKVERILIERGGRA